MDEERTPQASATGAVLNDAATMVVDAEASGGLTTAATGETAGGDVTLVQGDALGRYIVESQVGVGGMGIVYAAHDPQLDRTVAIKVLHTRSRRTRSGEARSRLIREAQAMAKLSHPNVVPVFDVGIADGQVFVAMELLDGGTLDVWLQGSRSDAEIVDVLLQAGRGLAAAHAGGFAHRDFKPSNVMVTSEGRAVVMDFGLARGLDGEASSGGGDVTVEGSALQQSRSEASDAATSRLTRVGVVMGTPAYMAPEQHLGKIPDARADQFSFSASAWEALQGARAFSANSLKELAKQKVHEGPRVQGRSIGAAIMAVLKKGMAAEPERRFASMSALLDAFERVARGRPRRRWALGGAVALGGLGLWFGAQGIAADAVRGCDGAEHRVDAIWNASTKSNLAAAFSATAAPFADDTWRSSAERIDRYVQSWLDAHRGACEAARDHTQTDSLIDRRMACLGRAESALGAMLSQLHAADAMVVQRAVAQVSSLPPLSRCTDADALSAEVAPPSDPQVAAEVQTLRASLDAARVAELAGSFQLASERALAVLERARGLQYAPLVAQSLVRHGSTELALGHHTVAESEWSEAAWLAAGVGADALAADAATRLVHLTISERADAEAALEWARHARAWLGRGPTDALAQARLESNVGVVHSLSGRFEQAELHFRRAYEAKREQLGDDDAEVAGALENIGLAVSGQGRLDDALVLHKRALSITEAQLGPDHPDVGNSLGNLGGVFDQMGQHADAVGLYERALAIQEAALGPDHPAVARTLDALGQSLSSQAQFAQARALHERALAIYRAHYGENHPEVAWSWGNLGVVTDQVRAYEDALRYYDKALEITLAVYGDDHEAVGATYANKAVPLAELGRLDDALAQGELGVSTQQALLGLEHPATAAALNSLGFVLFKRGDHEGSLAKHREALRIIDATLGPQHPEAAATLLDVAATLGELGKPGDAVVAVDRALVILAANPVSPAFVASAQFIKAQAQWDAGGDRGDAAALAQRALSLYAEHGETFSSERAEIVAWLAEHPSA